MTDLAIALCSVLIPRGSFYKRLFMSRFQTFNTSLFRSFERLLSVRGAVLDSRLRESVPGGVC